PPRVRSFPTRRSSDLPIAATWSRSSASSTCRASQRDRRLTISLSGLVDIGAEEHVLADRPRLETGKRPRRSEVAEEPRAGAAERRRDEQQQLVDEVSLEERGRERRTALEQ